MDLKFRNVAALVLGCALSVFAAVAQAQEAATVSICVGTAVVQRADGSVRSLAPGSMVRPGDVVSTQPNSSVRLKFSDGGELLVPSASQIRLDAYAFDKSAPQSDSLVMSLLAGGLRSITGLIGRRGSADAYRLQAGTASINIIGTDYLARLCLEDCTKAAAQLPLVAPAAAPDIAARVAQLVGQAVAIDKAGVQRALRVGSAIYATDVIETRAQSYAVLVFLDEGRVTLQPGARLAIERFRYEPGRPEAGISVMRLLRGGMRALTGALVRNNPRSSRVETVVATIGFRGTGFDAWCSGPCESGPGGGPLAQTAAVTPSVGLTEGLFVSTWEGEVEVSNPAGVLTVGVGQTVLVTARNRAPTYLPEIPQFMRDAPGPRPDGIQIDMKQLFGAETEIHSERGLYVLVKEGKVQLTQEQTILELERGEAAYANLERTEVYRLQFTPTFLERDSTLSAPGAGGLICAPF